MNPVLHRFGRGLLFRRKLSSHRKNLNILTIEGIPAIAVFFILGGPFQTSFLLYLGATPLQIGIAMAIPVLANIMQIVGALYIQRGKNRLLVHTVFGTGHRLFWVACGFIPLWFAESKQASMYLLFCALSFFCKYFSTPAWSSMVSDIVPSQIRGRYFGVRNTILWGVGVICVWIGGRVLETYPGGKGFEILFIICGVCTVANFLCLLGYPNPPIEKSGEVLKRDMLLAPFRNPMFRRSMLFIASWMFVMNTSIPLFNYVMQSIMHVSYETISYMTILQNVVMMGSYYVWGKLTLRYRTRTLLFWTLPFLALCCLAWSALSVLPALPVLLLVHVLLGIGLGGFNLLIFNFTIGETPRSERPMYLAVFNALTGIAGSLGPILGGYAYKQLNDAPQWVQTFGVSSAAGVLLLLALAVGSVTLLERKPLSTAE